MCLCPQSTERRGGIWLTYILLRQTPVWPQHTGNRSLTTLWTYVCWLTLGPLKSFYTSSLDIFGSQILCIILDIKPASDICKERMEAICSVGAWTQNGAFLFFGSKSSPSSCCLVTTDCIKVMQALQVLGSSGTLPGTSVHSSLFQIAIWQLLFLIV